MTSNTTNAKSTESLIIANYSLILIIIGTVLNILTCLILCLSKLRDKTKSIIYYMRAIAIFDILMLYGWNLNHYTVITYKFDILKYSISSCKFITFTSYFTPQASAWLRVFVCLDRYLCLSRFHQSRLSQPKTVLTIIACIISIAFLLNLHILIFVCYEKADGTISYLSKLYKIYPLWDYVNLGVYNCVPFIFMVVLNSAVSYHLIHFRRVSLVINSRIQHRSIAFALVITTSLFVVMTIPATVAYAFFATTNSTILHLLDGILYTYHIISFPIYLITFKEFRRECIRIFGWKCFNQNVAPLTIPPLAT